MKKSELRQIIKEEILNELKVQAFRANVSKADRELSKNNLTSDYNDFDDYDFEVTSIGYDAINKNIANDIEKIFKQNNILYKRKKLEFDLT